MSRKDEILRRKGVELLNSWRADWNKFVREALGVTLDREQRAILESVQFNPRTSVASGTARGKDFVAACAAVSFLYLTPRWNTRRELVENTKVALTAPTERQVKNIMLPEVSRLYNRAKQRGIILPGRLNSSDIRTDNAEWFLTGFKADNNNHEAWSGFHAAHTMFVVTEASGIGEDVFSAIEGNLQGDSRILIVFNPNTPVGYAARSQKGDRWAKFRLNSLTAPNVLQRRNVITGQVDYDWVKDKLEQWATPISEGDVSEELDDFLFEGQWYRPEDLFRVKVPEDWRRRPDSSSVDRTRTGTLGGCQWSGGSLERASNPRRGRCGYGTRQHGFLRAKGTVGRSVHRSELRRSSRPHEGGRRRRRTSTERASDARLYRHNRRGSGRIFPLPRTRRQRLFHFLQVLRGNETGRTGTDRRNRRIQVRQPPSVSLLGCP